MSFLSQITPVILTFNEEANIGRCLANLDWASDIVVVDSHSTDRTREICAANPRVRLFERAFDSHAGQWTYAAKETGVTTPWVLALDCDYMVTPQARAEMAALPAESRQGWWEAITAIPHLTLHLEGVDGTETLLAAGTGIFKKLGALRAL